MRKLFLLAVIAGLAVSMGGPASAGAPSDTPGIDLSRAIQAQEAHTGRLLAIDGVVGTGVGLGAGGEPVIGIFTEAPGLAGLPRSLDGVKVVVKVTGPISPLHHQCGHGGGPPGSDPFPCAPGITVDPTTGLVTTEGGGTDTFTVVLDTQPSANVTIDLSSSDTTEGTVSPPSLTFTPENGTTAQTVTVTGVDDGDEDGDIAYTIATDPAASDDPDYSGLNPADVSVTNTDNDGGSTGPTTDCATTEVCPSPVPIGVSSGNVENVEISFPFITCTGGTLGARLVAGENVFALSNNHIYANENSASPGSNILQPGLNHTNCDPTGSNVIGGLSDFELLVFNASACDAANLPDPDCNTMDAATASTTTAEVGNWTPSDGYGTPKSTHIICDDDDPNSSTETSTDILGECGNLLGLSVQKYGSTTGLTTGTITFVNVVLNVCYDSGCARFVDQIVIEGNGKFIKSGDSGSLLVVDGGADDRSPVGLLFAGSRSGKTAIANRIDLVLSRFSMTVDGE